MYIKNHLIFCCSLIIFLIKILNLLNINYNIWCITIVALFFSIFPDIDHPRSYIGYKFKIISYLLFYFFKHRTITHSLFFLFIIFNIIIYLNFFFILDLNIIIGIYVGYISHILADMITNRGIYFLWPCKYKFRIPFLYLFINRNKEFYFCIFLFIISVILYFYF